MLFAPHVRRVNAAAAVRGRSSCPGAARVPADNDERTTWSDERSDNVAVACGTDTGQAQCSIRRPRDPAAGSRPATAPDRSRWASTTAPVGPPILRAMGLAHACARVGRSCRIMLTPNHPAPGFAARLRNLEPTPAGVRMHHRPPPSSIIVTTWGGDTYYTQRCLASIGRWKTPWHELIVVVHDETPLLRLFLEHCHASGLIDRLFLAEAGHGHLRGVNLGMRVARHPYVFNINTDVVVGSGVVDDCALRLHDSPSLGMIAWHYDWAPHHEGTFWSADRLHSSLRLRDGLARTPGRVDSEHLRNIAAAPWFRGRVFRAVGDRRILCANTSFFGVRKRLWNRIGGFDWSRYPHLWADDFLCYAILESGHDIANLDAGIRCSQRPDRFVSFSDRKWDGIAEPDRDTDALSPAPLAAGPERQDRLGQLWTLLGDLTEHGWRLGVDIGHGIPDGAPPSLLQSIAGSCASRREPDVILTARSDRRAGRDHDGRPLLAVGSYTDKGSASGRGWSQRLNRPPARVGDREPATRPSARSIP